LLEAAGLTTAMVHGTLHYPNVAVDPQFMSAYAAHLFAPMLAPAMPREPFVDGLVERFAADLNLHGVIFPTGPSGSPGSAGATLAQLERDEDAVRTWVAAELDHAELCIAAICEAVERHSPDVVLMSATFEGQLVAALVIARRLRRSGSQARIAIGGSACFREAAEVLIAHYGEVDAVCFTEGENVVVSLVEGLQNGDLTAVPGIVWRDGENTRVNAAPPSVRMDDSPVPDYSDYFLAHARSPWRDLPPRLFVELSRGCWWGQKHLCTFCGLNAENLGFRAKSPERALTDLTELYERYPTATRLAATDNILAMGYLDTLLPRLTPLAESQRPLRLFFEVKSNLRKDQLVALAKAGIRHVQPGIESFSDEVLRLMRKGNTALGQIQFIKWCAEVGITASYNIIVMNPGEEASWYRDMMPLIDAIDHLPAPDNVTPLWLERFSPYHTTPDRFGITAVRPRSYYRGLYPDLGDQPNALDKLAYVFDYDHAVLSQPDHIEAVRAFALRVGRWQWECEEGLAFYRDDDTTLTLVDQRPGREREVDLPPQQAALYRWLDQVRPASTFSGRFDIELDTDTTLAAWRDAGWVVNVGDRWLATLPRRATLT
jgi:ribosomal peptide maturation radical SAM protein 1